MTKKGMWNEWLHFASIGEKQENNHFLQPSSQQLLNNGKFEAGGCGFIKHCTLFE